MMKGKIALVLGGRGNIGSAICRALEKQGAIVCQHGPDGEYRADVKNIGDIEALTKKINGEKGPIEILINCVSSPAKIGNLEKKTWTDFSEHLTVQLKSILESTRLVIPGMKEKKWGRIINILTSYTVGQPPSGLADYVSAKYAALGLTKCMARELAKHNITVNAISPSLIQNSFSGSVPEKMLEILAAQNPTGRLATADDVANTVVFLCLFESGYINGGNFLVSGGNPMN